MAWYLHEPDDDEFKFVGKGRGNRALRSGVTPRALATPPAASKRVLDGAFPASVAGDSDCEATASKFASAVLARVEELRGLKLCASLHAVLFSFFSRLLGAGSALSPASSDMCSCPEVDVVGYGLGTTAFGTNTPIQLAALVFIARTVRELLPKFACAACRAMHSDASGNAGAADDPKSPSAEASAAAVAGRVHVAAFDPLTTPTDAALLRRLGIAVIETNEGCRRPARVASSCGGRCAAALASAAAAGDGATHADPKADAAGGCGSASAAGTGAPCVGAVSSSACTCSCPRRVVPLVAFMPHCDAPLYGALLAANLALAPASLPALSAGASAAAAVAGGSAASACSGAAAAVDSKEPSGAVAASPAAHSSATLLPHVCLIGNSLTWYARSHALSAKGSRATDAGNPRSKRRGKGHSSAAAADSAAPTAPSSEDAVHSAASLVASGGEPDPARVFAAFAASCTVLDAAVLSSATIKGSDGEPPALRAVEVPFPLGDADVLVERALDATSAHLFLG